MESFSHTSALENMRQENSLEKKQIEQLMLKLKEKDNIQNELEKEIGESSETLSFLSIKLKVMIYLIIIYYYFKIKNLLKFINLFNRN